ncbi:hypothetical protein FSARC_8971 [Fusarium sarcochroum]|uniref:Uncharacterized protein n=1 Tax=Fusarium sarcochroum TaxID=1208366 RepID=A0A8H4TRW0_9HYPO|nr:hypothetical protein FSARC_8971 [Fusarium sarcochroum]
MQTINPALLMHQAPNAPSYSSRPSNPISATSLVQSTPESLPTPSPYSDIGRQELWMGSVGFTDRFTRGSMGYGRTIQDTPYTYEPEPLEPLFGRLEPLQPLPSPTVEQNRMPVADRMGGDLAWLHGRPQSGWIEAPTTVMCNGEDKLVTQRFYINRSFRDNGLRT